MDKETTASDNAEVTELAGVYTELMELCLKYKIQSDDWKKIICLTHKLGRNKSDAEC